MLVAYTQNHQARLQQYVNRTSRWQDLEKVEMQNQIVNIHSFDLTRVQENIYFWLH